jgi:hypothetical protein
MISKENNKQTKLKRKQANEPRSKMTCKQTNKQIKMARKLEI